MRRAAVLMVLLVCGAGAACTERLLLPGSQSDAGTNGNPDAGSGSGGRSGNGGAGGSSCKNRTLIRSMSQPKADLLLLVGRDMSMSTHFVDDTTNPSNPTGTTRMAAVQSILDSLVTSYQFTVNFGYLEFPGTGTALCSSATCCADAPSVIPPSPFSFAAIDKALRECDGAPNMFGCVSQSDARPLADTFKSAAGVFASLSSNGGSEQYAVLLIDGPPACGSEDLPSSCMAAKGQMGAQLLQQNNINLSIVTVGQDAESVACLQSIAETSGTAGNPYQARDTSQLLDSLTTIVTGAAQGACKIDLLTAVADPSQVSVIVYDSSGMGTPIPKDPSGQNGWKFVSGSSQSRIVVQGPACQTVQKAKPTDVQVYGCPP